MIEVRDRYKKSQESATRARSLYYQRETAIADEIEASRRYCQHCRLNNLECDCERPCSACVGANIACSLLQRREKPPTLELEEGQTRPSWMWEMNKAEHSDLIDLANLWRQHLAQVIDLRLQFLIEYPDAFAKDDTSQRVGHLTAVNVAKQELCKVTGRIVDHLSWRDLPQEDFGEPPINWNRSTMADHSHYGQHTFPSASKSPTKRLREAAAGCSNDRRLARSD